MTHGALQYRRDKYFNIRTSSSGNPVGGLLVLFSLAILLGVPSLDAASLEVHVNYAHNWIAGTTDPGASVDVEVRDEQDAVKGETTVTADGGGGFFVDCPAYDPEPCPDINPGDTIIVDVVGLQRRIEPVGSIEGQPDADADTISGTLDADWFTGPLDVRCEIWGPSGPPAVTTTANTDGGTFSCNFSGIWDLHRGDMVALFYFEPDGDRVINIVVWPWMRVNSTHDWAGGNYAAGHPVTVTATESDGTTVKGIAQTETNWGAGWGEDGFNTEPPHWSPGPPDILPGDKVEFDIPETGYNNIVTVGDIDATIDVDADTVGGTVSAAWITGPVQVECHPWGSPVPVDVKVDSVEPNGIATFTCNWSGEWDILPGQEVGVMYLEPGDDDRIIEIVIEPAPHLVIEKWPLGEPGAGGNMVFGIRIRNDGDAPAENVTITDNMAVKVGENYEPGGLSYLSDTSGVTITGSGSGPIVWDFGTVDPGAEVVFDVYVQVTAAAGSSVRNTAQIETTVFDAGPPEQKLVMWEGQVVANDTHLNVNKGAWTNDPAPGGSVVFSLHACNHGPTGSTEATLTDTLGTGLTLDSWWTHQPGWSEVSSSASTLVLSTPSIPGHHCSEILVQATVGSGLSPGDPLTNMAVISAANDIEIDDNITSWNGSVGAPHTNLWVTKRLIRGSLVPGGELFYRISYGNNGNQTVAPVRLVDTLPVGTEFTGSWHEDPYGGFDFNPVVNESGIVVWELTDLQNGATGTFEVRLIVDPATAAGTLIANGVEICGADDPPEPCAPVPGEDTYDDNFSSWNEILNPSGPNLRIRKWGRWEPGDSLHYTIRFDNIGDQIVNNAEIVDTLAAGTNWGGWWELEFDPNRLDGDIVHESGTLTWNFHEIHGGETGRVRFNAVLDGSQEPLQWFTNLVAGTIPDGDPTPDDNMDSDNRLWGNHCGGYHVTLLDETYGEDFWCYAPGSITAENVTVTASGQVILRAPSVVLGNNFAVEAGGSAAIGGE